MTRKQIKQKAVDAIDRLILAAKDLAAAEAMLLEEKSSANPTGNKATGRQQHE